MTLIVFQPVSTGFALLDRGFQPRAGRRKQRRFVSQSGRRTLTFQFYLSVHGGGLRLYRREFHSPGFMQEVYCPHSAITPQKQVLRSLPGLSSDRNSPYNEPLKQVDITSGVRQMDFQSTLGSLLECVR
jgi:hypothetical protein